MKPYIIGIMITMNDIVIGHDWMTKYRSWFDKIYVLDNSDNRAEASWMFQSHDCIYYHQSEYPNIRPKDHPLRKVLYDQAVKDTEGEDNRWFVVCHPDEFYIEDIRQIIELADSHGDNLIVTHNCHNVPHISEIDDWNKTQSYKTFNHFCFPGSLEHRSFKYSPDLHYDDFTHSRTIPHGRYSMHPKRMKVLHYKVQSANIEDYMADGTMVNSSFSTLKSHYPEGHRFEKTEDFFLTKPAGVYAGNKMFRVITT